MKSFNRLLLFVFIIAAASCSSPSKMYKKGNYESAVTESIRKLRSSPNKAKHQNVLLQAYPMAVQMAKRYVVSKIDEALFAAMLHVVVQAPKTPERFQISADFFYSNLVTEMNKANQKKYVHFYTPEEAKNSKNINTPLNKKTTARRFILRLF